MPDQITREELLRLFIANFNDGESIESRISSNDMWSASAIVEFITDFAAPYTTERERLARIDEQKWIQDKYMEELERTGGRAMVVGISNNRITTLTNTKKENDSVLP